MSDVTAVVLSIGEPYTERAIASVRRQTRPVAETVVVEHVSPFYRAINTAAARVRTEFFIQVDADMVLDPSCMVALRSCMAERVGVVIGRLRDPLRGAIFGVKLFRRCCFDQVQFRDSVCQDNDFSDDLLREARWWTRAYALSYTGETPAAWHSFGEHRPNYTPHYTFCKFLVEGARARHRKGDGKFHSLLQQLRTSPERAAVIAVIAVSHGLFLSQERDLLVPYPPNPEAEFVDGFLGDHRDAGEPPAIGHGLVREDLATGFKRSYQRGIRCRQRDDASTFVATLNKLRCDGSLAASVALVGLCHGLFSNEYREAEAEEAFATLRELLPVRQ